MRKMEAQFWNTYTFHTHFYTFGTDMRAQSVVFFNKISASELSRKFIQVALLVGMSREEKKRWLVSEQRAHKDT